MQWQYLYNKFQLEGWGMQMCMPGSYAYILVPLSHGSLQVHEVNAILLLYLLLLYQ